MKACLFFPGEKWASSPPDSCSRSNDNAAADNDHDYDDDMLITGVKIIIIIAAVGMQMYNSPRCNYICAVTGEKIHFRSNLQPPPPLPSMELYLFPHETSAPSPFPPVGDKEAVYQTVCSQAIRTPRWDHQSFNCLIQLGRKMLLSLSLFLPPGVVAEVLPVTC